MLLSFAMMLLLGMAAGWACARLKLPPLLGMLLTGVLLGPCCLNVLDETVLTISPQLRRMALVIILLRAGLNLRLEDLKKVGRSAILMCFVPACCEIAGMVLLAPMLFPLSRVEALVLGTVIAAVSPAVIVPHMLRIMEEGYGVERGIPQMILAGASADDVFVIVLFTSCTAMAAGGSFAPAALLKIPLAILLGMAGGAAAGELLYRFQRAVRLSGEKSLIVCLCVAFLLLSVEDASAGYFSGLIGVMTMGMRFARCWEEAALSLSLSFSRLWTGAEILLFVLVGAAVDVGYAFRAGPAAIALIFAVLVFRMLGVLLCVAGTSLRPRERLFCALAYTPKATVQAAIGAIPLSMGLACGNTVLTVAVIAILVTAPLGAFLIDLSYRRCLSP